MRPYAELFQWNVICAVCRKKIKSSQAVKRWDGLIVGREHEGCYETKHPSDMPQPIYREPVPHLLYRGPTTDVETAQCTVLGRSGVAGFAVAGCAIAGMEADVSMDFDTSSDTILSDSL